MATITLSGIYAGGFYSYSTDGGDFDTSTGLASATLILDDATELRNTGSGLALEAGGISEVTLTIGEDFDLVTFAPPDVSNATDKRTGAWSVVRIFDGAQVTDALKISYYRSSQFSSGNYKFYLRLSGDPLPENPGSKYYFADARDDISIVPISSGPFGVDQSFSLITASEGGYPAPDTSLAVFATGSAADDDFLGGVDGDSIDGGDGDDRIFGLGGFDTLLGGNGRDEIGGGDLADRIDGGAGQDLIGGGTGNDTLNGDNGSDTIYGGRGDDRLDGGSGSDLLTGGAGDDTMDGGHAPVSSMFEDTLLGGFGDDVILSGSVSGLYADGGAGRDKIQFSDPGGVAVGGLGADTLTGNSGDDTMDGGGNHDLIMSYMGGDDVLTGGGGADTFLFVPVPNRLDLGEITITDFRPRQDEVQLKSIAKSWVSFGATDDGDALLIINGGKGYQGSIAFEGIAAGSLDIDNFVFV